MKKFVIKLLIGGIILTIMMYYLQRGIQHSEEELIDKITEEKEINMNEWIEKYQTNDFSKIELKDTTNLIGYVFEKTGTNLSLLNNHQKVIEYTAYTTKKPIDTSLIDLGVSFTGDTIVTTTYTETSLFTSFIKEFGSLIFFFLIFIIGSRFLFGRGNGAGGLMNIQIGKKSTNDDKKTKFSDIAGMEEVKNELEEVIDYLKDPEKYKKVGARHPKGILLYGEPGSGKTLLARAVAGEANVAFFSASGSEFMEMLVGMGAAKVRTLFKQAKDAGKAIIFIDEIDAIGKKRGNGTTGGHQEQEQTLNQILTEMDGFETDTNVIVIAATNRPDILDPALLRAGRFDRKIYVTIPTAEEREAIFTYYLKDKKISPDFHLSSFIKRTSGLVGADIENIVNEASLKVAKENREILDVQDFEYALEKVIMGPEKKSKGFQEKEKQIIAYHELGHALLAHLQPEADSVEKISIVRRGQALGLTRTTPTEDKNLYSKAYLLQELSVLLAGRASEEIFFGEDQITTGASNDFEKANSYIRKMLTLYGMDEDLGLVIYKEEQDMNLYKPYSEETAKLIDKKMKSYLTDAYEFSKKTIREYQDILSKIAGILIKKEYIAGEDFAQMIDYPESINQFEEEIEKKTSKEQIQPTTDTIIKDQELTKEKRESE